MTLTREYVYLLVEWIGKGPH